MVIRYIGRSLMLIGLWVSCSLTAQLFFGVEAILGVASAIILMTGRLPETWQIGRCHAAGLVYHDNTSTVLPISRG